MIRSKGLSIKRRGDTIRVVLSSYGQKYFEKQVPINDKTKVKGLVDELKEKGIKFIDNKKERESANIFFTKGKI